MTANRNARPETAASVTYLAERLASNWSLSHSSPSALRLLDLCTGTGCIPLLFRHLFFKHLASKRFPCPELQLLGVDVSAQAVQLARLNDDRLSTRSAMSDHFRSSAEDQFRCHSRFVKADVLKGFIEDQQDTLPTVPSNDQKVLGNCTDWDILTCNPPYISPDSFRRDTARSVRLFEPKLALVPPSPASAKVHPGDTFYPKILDIAKRLGCKIILVEVSGMQQALRVANMFNREGIFEGIEIWRDNPQERTSHIDQIAIDVFKIRGGGHGRSVLCWKAEAKPWLSMHLA